MMRSKISFIAVCLVFVIVSLQVAPAVAENTAKGKLTVDGKTVEIKHAYAQSHKFLTDDKNKPLTEVLLCDAELPASAMTDTFARMDLVTSGKVHCVINAISSEKKLANFEIAHNGIKMEAAAVVNSTSHLFEPSTMDGKTIAGRARTSSPQTGAFSKVAYSYDITFSADIVLPSNKRVGTKLPAGGGDLWKAYIAFNKRVKTMDVKEMKKMAPPEKVNDMSDEELEMMKELAVAMLPKAPKFTEGYVDGDKGVLFVTDTVKGKKRYGIVDMTKKDGEWVVGNQSWGDNPQ